MEMEEAHREFSDEMYDVELLNSLESIEEHDLHRHVEEVQEKEKEIENGVQATVYKPRHLDTETLVKGEINQLILTEVSEVTSAKALNDMKFEVEEQITTLREKTDRLLNKNKSLDEEIEIDKRRLKECEEISLQTNEMIELLKQNVQKREKPLKESRVLEILEKSQQQYNKLQSLSTYDANIKEEYENITTKLCTDNESNKTLKHELNHKLEIVENLRQKSNDVKKANSFYKEEITQYQNKKLLQEKLTGMKNKRVANEASLENEITSKEDLLRKMYSIRDKQIEKLTKLNQKKDQLVLHQSQDYVEEIDSLKSTVNAIQQEISQKDLLLATRMEEIETKKRLHETSTQKLRQDYQDTSYQLDELRRNICSLNKTNTENYAILNALHIDYVNNKCEENLRITNKVTEKQTIVHELEVILTNKKIENDVNQSKFNELQKERDNLIRSYKSMENEQCDEQNNLSKQLSELEKEYELIKSEQEKEFRELRKKKEYALATSSYLKEKLENLHQEVRQAENLINGMEDEIAVLNRLVEKKQNSLEEIKRKLEDTNNNKIQLPAKSGLKSPIKENVMKKVQFNEILSFKSTTESSENSSQTALEAKSQLERSFCEWLDDV